MQIFKLNTINNKKNLLKIKLCLNHIHFFAHMVRKYLLHKSLLAYTHNASFPQAHEYLRSSIKNITLLHSALCRTGRITLTHHRIQVKYICIRTNKTTRRYFLNKKGI